MRGTIAVGTTQTRPTATSEVSSRIMIVITIMTLTNRNISRIVMIKIMIIFEEQNILQIMAKNKQQSPNLRMSIYIYKN